MIKAIVAVDAGNAIGWTDGRLPWKIPTDMKRFKELTTGCTVVMGRTTYQSLGRPNGLPNRKNVVLTTRPYSEVRSQFGEVDIISSLDYVELQRGVEDQWIIGGASVYAEALRRNMVDELYVTLVHGTSGADVTLPFELYSWKLFILRQRAIGNHWEVTDIHNPDCTDSPSISFMTFKKL